MYVHAYGYTQIRDPPINNGLTKDTACHSQETASAEQQFIRTTFTGCDFGNYYTDTSLCAMFGL